MTTQAPIPPPPEPGFSPINPPGQSVTVRLPERKPVVTWAILAMTVFIYLVQMGTKSLLGGDLPLVFMAKINEAIELGQLWRLLTPAVLHASVTHLLFNMLALFSFGRRLEIVFGPGRFLALYVVGAFAGNVLSYAFSPNISVGSSTAIFGLLAAEAVFLFHNRQTFGATARRELINVASIAVINFLFGFSPGIDNWGHLGGFLGGMIFAWFAAPRFHVKGIFPQFHLEDTQSPNAAVTGTIIAALVFTVIFLIRFLLR